MNSMNVSREFASSANELTEDLASFLSTTITSLGMFAASCVDPAITYSVTFEMTIKPLPEEPSISGSHPLTDGSER